MTSAAPFRYQGFSTDPGSGLLTCRYALGDREFTEKVSFAPGPRGPLDDAASRDAEAREPGAAVQESPYWTSPAAAQAARLVFLLAGVSYYKTAAPAVIDLGETPVSDREREFLRTFYFDGLGEFAYRNGLDLTGLRITGGGPAPDPAPPAGPSRGILIPFGGGIDSIVTVETMRGRADAALFVMSRPGDRFDAIERPAAVTGLPVVRAGREIDPALLRSKDLGFLNGHVPVTGILSAIAVMAAVLDGRGTVVMSNEWSASIPTLEADGRAINHQYSKSASFENDFRAVLDGAFGGGMTYFSALRPFTELWVAQKFAALTQYHDTFRSCNRAFHIDPARRLDHWCGQCDKCCFIDLILAPFLPEASLRQIFAGSEPLADPSLADKFRALLGTLPDAKPFECVGEVNECRAAALLAVQRPDRAGTPLLRLLTAELPAGSPPPPAADLLRPVGEHAIPDAYATDDLLV